MGFKCAPLTGPHDYANKTANAHPVVIIHPELFPLVPVRTTFATTRFLIVSLT
jgi:hypothetical protein